MIDNTRLFNELGGCMLYGDTPLFAPDMFYTEEGKVPYLKKPGVAMIAHTEFVPESIREYLKSYPQELGFEDYLNDVDLPSGTRLCKTAGQTCYSAFGSGRTKNDQASKYFTNIKEQSHGSIAQHANYSFMLYGVSRSLVMELIRHSSGTGISQQSQRYVDSKVLRFVERPEYQNDEFLHSEFEARIEKLFNNYIATADYLYNNIKPMEGESKRDLRKRVQQTARSVLPNETEAPLVWTANARALRHIIESRCNKHAESEMRELFIRVFLCMYMVEPILFEDYSVQKLEDGTYFVYTPYKKI